MIVLLLSVLGSLHSCIAQTSSAGWTKAITFNTALTPNNLILGYHQRKEAFLSSLRTDGVWRNADIVCLQEVHSPTDQQLVAQAATHAGLNYSYFDTFVVDAGHAPTACPAATLDPFLGCGVLMGCTGMPTPTEVINCLVKRCKTPELLALLQEGQSCINCLVNLQTAASLCKTTQEPAAKYSMETFGLVILSRTPLQHTSIHAFSDKTSIFRRGYVKAEVENIGTVLCAHLYPRAEGQDYIGSYTSFELHNRQNAEKLITALGGKQGMIMGDLNSGPARPSSGVHALFPANFYDYLQNGSFFSPYVNEVGMCTLCEDNNLQEISGVPVNETENQIIDHILLRNHTKIVRRVKRLFESKIVRLDNSTFVSLSDHYGVQVQFQASAAFSPHPSFCVSLAITLLLSLLLVSSLQDVLA